MVLDPDTGDLVELQQFVLAHAGSCPTGYALLEDQKAGGTHGGTATQGTWQLRDINTVVADTIGVSLANNSFTLPAGTYRIKAKVPGLHVDRHMARLINITTGEVVAYGTSEYSDETPAHGTTSSLIETCVTLTSSTVFEVHHQVGQTNTNVGLGLACGTVLNIEYETYTRVSIERI